MYGSESQDTPRERKDRRALSLAIWIGVVAGLGHGIPRYGLFHVSTVSMAGIGVIATVGLWAAIVALLPARKPE